MSSSNGFDPACHFLLSMRFENLFYALGRESEAQEYVCKGCDARVKRTERERHHAHHKRVEKKRRERAALKTKQQSAAKARAAKRTIRRENGE